MAYIAPNTTIILLRGVPLDNTYEHTIYWGSAQSQHDYFVTKMKYTLNANTYQRVRRDYIRVDIPADDLYDCNYLMFQNTSFGTKWFYAFIQSVEYVNNTVSEIKYELDVMQTWHFSYQLGWCFVEREHSATDNIGDNIVPENIEIGELIARNKTDFDMSTMYVCAMTSKTSEGAAPTGRTINGVYTPLNVIAGIPATDTSTLNELLEEFVGEGQENAIVSLYQYPAFCGDASTETPETALASIAFPTADINGYTPKNKKLFTYPYCCLVVSNNQGQTAEFRWEDFTLSSGNAQFTIVGVFQGTPCVMCYPRNHKGIINDYDSGLTISSFPMCPFSGDAYQAWIAQNRSSITTSIIGSTITGMQAGALTGGPIGGAAGAVGGLFGSILSTVARKSDLQNTPPQVHGQTSCDSLNVGIGRVGFTFKALQIKAQFAEIVDGFFDMFGYATNKLKVPGRTTRQHWNYVKLGTVEFVGSSSVPSEDLDTISKIYKSGVTFWKNPSEIGNYSLLNSPVSNGG